MRTLFILLGCSFILMSSPASLQAQAALEPRIAFAAFKDGQWDIFSISPAGTDLRQVTNDAFDDEDPAYSPDGQQLAYASRRNGNWDIYRLDLTTGQETRLTSHPDYDSAPAWSPDGSQLAFEAYQSGDLDIWLMDASGDDSPVNLTTDSEAGDFEPAWGNDELLYFASWRAGNNDLWSLDLAGGTVKQLTSAETSENQPVWNSQAEQVAFSRDDLGDEDLFVFVDDPAEPNARTWLGSISQPAFSPDGQSIAGLYQTLEGVQLLRFDDNEPIPTFLTKKTTIQGAISWQMAVNAGTPIETLLNEDETALYVETLTPSTSSTGEPYDLIRINDLDVGSPWLADTVDESYQALRQRVHSEVGYDFLGELSDAHRGADFFSDASQYSSWHKSGRAIDTLFELTGNRMEIVRQNMDGETYWRILLWCEDQSGRCGQPMTVNPWDYSYEARNLIAPEQGGIEKANQYGYYLDFTTLADIYGWERIASYDDEDFSWTWHFKAFEYWHYQKRLEAHIGSGNWYQAMKDVYAPSIIDEYFTWENMREADEDPYVIVLKGVPVPPIVTRWWQTLLP